MPHLYRHADLAISFALCASMGTAGAANASNRCATDLRAADGYATQMSELRAKIEPAFEEAKRLHTLYQELGCEGDNADFVMASCLALLDKMLGQTAGMLDHINAYNGAASSLGLVMQKAEEHGCFEAPTVVDDGPGLRQLPDPDTLYGTPTVAEGLEPASACEIGLANGGKFLDPKQAASIAEVATDCDSDGVDRDQFYQYCVCVNFKGACRFGNCKVATPDTLARVIQAIQTPRDEACTKQKAAGHKNSHYCHPLTAVLQPYRRGEPKPDPPQPK